MRQSPDPEWDPTSEAVLNDQVAAYDEMRRRCPVAYSDTLGWSLFRHADVARVLEDHATFSNVVSTHRSVPSGMDPPEHAQYRQALDGYFSAEAMRRFEPVCRGIARGLLGVLPEAAPVDLMAVFAEPFALRCQCAFMGWPDALVEPLQRWTRKSQDATRAGDRRVLSEVAEEFRVFVEALLAERRRGGSTEDVTTSLMGVRINGAPLSDADLTSIIRNWTVGEVASLAASVGIIAHALATQQDLQGQLRADLSLLPPAIEYILRVTGPLVANRRVVTRDVEIGGRKLCAGERVTVMWIAANRDPEAFACADQVRPDRDPRDNLLFGAGIHVCPGAPLARLELRVAVEALLQRARCIQLEAGALGQRAVYPANGWLSLPICLS
jgi:cytochrome P450